MDSFNALFILLLSIIAIATVIFVVARQKQAIKQGAKSCSFGCILVFFQIIILLSNPPFIAFSSGAAFLYTFIMFLADNIIGIIGIVFIVRGIMAIKRPYEETEEIGADPEKNKAAVPQIIRMSCDKYKDDPEQLKTYLEACVRDRRISDLQKDLLLEEYLSFD